MKNKMRKMTVNDTVYLYRIQSKYYGDNRAVVTLRIYMEGYRNTPYVMGFQCFEGNYDGAVLAVGTTLFNHKPISQNMLICIVLILSAYAF